jgi:hypothetical protein
MCKGSDRVARGVIDRDSQFPKFNLTLYRENGGWKGVRLVACSKMRGYDHEFFDPTR